MDFTNWQPGQYIVALTNAAREWRIRELRGNLFARGKHRTCLDLVDTLRRLNRFASARQQAYAEQLIRWVQPRPRVAFDPAGQDSWEQRNTDSAQPLPRIAQEAPSVSQAALLRIRALFDAARRNNIRRPAISLTVEVSGVTVRLRLAPAPETGRHPGCIYVTTGNHRLYVGRIAPDGMFIGTTEDASVLGAIRAFGDDPVRIARAHGLRTGNCCFCRRELTDARSTAMGYGPICAEHYGLEWGNQRASSVVTMADAESAEARQAREESDAELASERSAVEREVARFILHRRPAATSAPAQGALDYEDEDQQFM